MTTPIPSTDVMITNLRTGLQSKRHYDACADRLEEYANLEVAVRAMMEDGHPDNESWFAIMERRLERLPDSRGTSEPEKEAEPEKWPGLDEVLKGVQAFKSAAQQFLKDMSS